MGETAKERLSVEIEPEEHRRIKMWAARHGISIRQFVLESLKKQLEEEAKEEKELSLMTTSAGPALREVWDNDRDAAYDKL